MAVSLKRVGFVGFVVAGLLLLGTACSSSNNSSTTATTVPSAAQCDSINALGTSLQAKMQSAKDAGTAMSNGDGAALKTAQSNFSSLATDLQSAVSTAPTAIQGDLETLATAISAFSTSLNAVTLTNINDPAVQAQLNAASTAMSNNTAAQTAGQNIGAWVSANCPTS
jgi:hypothetical protein